MKTSAIYFIIALFIFLAGFGIGHHAKTMSDNAAIVKQVEKVAKIDAKNEAQVEKQDDSDKQKIRQLEDDLSAARRDAAGRRVPIPPKQSCLSGSEADAGTRSAPDPDRKPIERYEAAYRALRDELLLAGDKAERLRLQALSCQTQWPR